jgi:tetratricopeptide (TPR) repeat protein
MDDLWIRKEIDECYKLQEEGDYQKAIEIGEIAIKKYPKDPLAYNHLSRAYFRAGKSETGYKTKEIMNNLIKKEKPMIYVYKNLGTIYRMLGELDEALLYYEKGLNLAKDMGDKNMASILLYNIAITHYCKGNLSEALKCCQESLNLGEITKNNIYYKVIDSTLIEKKDNSICYHLIALIYRRKEDYPKAIEYFKKAMELSETYKDYRSVSLYKKEIEKTLEQMKKRENTDENIYKTINAIKKKNKAKVINDYGEYIMEKIKETVDILNSIK